MSNRCSDPSLRRDRELLSEASLAPPELRRRVLDVLCRRASAESALWYGVAPDGEAHRVTEWLVEGDQIINDAMVVQSRDKITGRDFRRPVRAWATRLHDLRASLRDAPAASVARYREQITKPFGITDYLSLIVFDGDVCVGWAGSIRLGKGALASASRRATQPVIRDVADTLVRAHRLEQARLPEDGADVVLTPDGEVELVSATARAWATSNEVRSALSAGARAMDRGEVPPARVGGASAHWSRLSGVAMTRYLVHLSAPPTLTIPGALALTPQQRVVAELAERGATVQEIAVMLERSPETVRSHLRAIYARLGVSTRIELARALESDDGNGRSYR